MKRANHPQLRTHPKTDRPSLRLVTRHARTESAWRRSDDQAYELQLSFEALTLIYRALQAAKTLSALPPQDELLNDTIQLVDQALDRAA